MDYGCGLSSAQVVVTDRCEVNKDDQDCEDEAVMKMVMMKLMEVEIFKMMDVPSCDFSNNLDHE